MPSEFLGIEPTTEKSGLTGYYLTPFVGVYRRTLSLAHFLEGRKQANTAVPDFLERPESDQYLEPWTRRDIERLGLSYALLQEKSREPEQEPSVLELVAARSGRAR
jgi:hypothetical protein